MKVTLKTPIVLTAISEVEVLELTDRPGSKTVDAVVDVGGQRRVLTLWGVDEYDLAGQWTDNDAKGRVDDLLSGGVK